MSALEDDLVPPLRAAFGDGSLELSLQPEVDLRAGTVPGMEALPRWNHPSRGVLDSAAVEHAVMRAGLVGAFSRWLVREAVAEALRWHELAVGTRIRPPRLWVNISRARLALPEFETDVHQLLGSARLPRGAVGLEFTEETLGLGGRGVPAMLGRLRNAGASIGVDRFGSWFASLSTLDLLPLDLVRIDHRYQLAMFRDAEGEAVLASIITLAHRRGIAVSAEGVDSVVMASRLAAMRCDRAAGPAFSPPLSVADARMIVTGKGQRRRPTAGAGHSHPAGGASWSASAGASKG